MPQFLQLNAVNLKSSDIGENDKLLKLFSYEKGLVTARIRGVKKAQAKLRFAGEPFCFGEYLLHKGGGGYYTVTGCESKELFYNLREKLESFTAAAAMAEFCLGMEEQNQDSALFKLLLSCLNALCYSGIKAENVLIYFLADALKISGGIAGFGKCCACGANLDDSAAMDTLSGGFLCPGCNYKNIKPMPRAVYKTIRFISNAEDVSRLNTIRCATFDAADALNCINIFIHSITGKKINSADRLIALIKENDTEKTKKP